MNIPNKPAAPDGPPDMITPEEHLHLNRPMENETPQAILLEIYRTMGTVEAQNDQIIAEQARAAEARGKIYKTQESLDRRMDAFDGGDAVDYKGGYLPTIKAMENMHAKLAGAALIIGAVISGAFQLVVYAVSNFSEIKAALRDMFR